MHDVIIVGAGPAGSVLAALLAAQGVKVLVLERESLPRRKPCGESLNPGAVAALARVLPAGKFAAILSSMEHSLIHGWRLTSGKAELLASFPAGQFGMACAREKLDYALALHAGEAGAKVIEQMRVQRLIWEQGRVAGVVAYSAAGQAAEFRARLVIGADGIRSAVARCAGLSSFGPLRKTAFTARVSGVRDLQPRVELFTGRGLVVGLAPIGGGEANMTLAQLSGDGSAAAVAAGLKESGAVKNEAGHADMDTYTATDTQMETLEAASFFVNVSGKAPASCDGTVRASAPAEADNRAASAKSKEGRAAWLLGKAGELPELAERLQGVACTGEVLACGPFDRRVRATQQAGLLLIGDAAGYYDPLTGQGIYRALSSAELAAPLLLQALEIDSDAPLARYAALQQSRFAPAIRLQKLIEWTSRHELLWQSALRGLGSLPAARSRLAAVIGDCL
ncbi:NAD(P)/FAD-dependent oxidoreductase [Paenibacillus sp. FSL H8-0537]|uniref:NAD(P)/FAD-dependent oxidoreductase n=1 Tax=Paenibacillus sp. FSL H8-0537 TaxID=2921399 RepID=UPI0031015D5D